MSLNAQYVMGAIAFLVVGGGIAWWTIRTRTGMSRRRAAFEGMARQHGMDYRQYAGSLGDFRFKMLHSGDVRMFMNVLSGPWQGIPVVAADYWFGSGPANPYSTWSSSPTTKTFRAGATSSRRSLSFPRGRSWYSSTIQ